MLMHPIIWLQISSVPLHLSWHWIPKLGYLQGFVQSEPWYPTLQSRRIVFLRKFLFIKHVHSQIINSF